MHGYRFVAIDTDSFDSNKCSILTSHTLVSGLHPSNRVLPVETPPVYNVAFNAPFVAKVIQKSEGKLMDAGLRYFDALSMIDWTKLTPHDSGEEFYTGPKSLGALAYQFGVYPGELHLKSCGKVATLIQLLSKIPNIDTIIKQAMESVWELCIFKNTPFESNLILRAADYRWNAEGKTWYKIMRLSEETVEQRNKDIHAIWGRVSPSRYRKYVVIDPIKEEVEDLVKYYSENWDLQ